MRDFNFYSVAESIKKMRYVNDDTIVQGAIVKSLLHDCIFQALYNHNLLAKIVFQGGTALQRIYNLPRFSEDLNFVCPHPDNDFFADFNQKFRIAIMESLSQYGIETDRVYVKSPDELNESQEALKVRRWEMRIDLAGKGRRRDMVRIEIAHIPAEDSEQKLLMPFAPQYMQCPPILLNVESEKEIMADKIVALCCRPYLKYRDVFDLWYLQESGIRYDNGMVEKKFEAYQVDKKTVLGGLENKIQKLGVGLSEYHLEMGDFLHSGWARAENDPWHRKALENAAAELLVWRDKMRDSIANSLVQRVIKEGLDPRTLEKTMPLADADKVREELRKAAENPEGWGVSAEAFEVWGKAQGVARERRIDTPAGPRIEIVYDDF